MYSEKFEEFQQALSKSNDVFGTFKKEMDKVKFLFVVVDSRLTSCALVHTHTHTLLQMSKTIATLDKESTLWKSRYEKCNKSLLDVSEEVGVC